MKKTLTITAVVLISALAFAAAVQAVGVVDGHTWAGWNDKSKKAYIFGFVDFLNFFSLQLAMGDEETSREEAIESLNEEGSFVTKDGMNLPAILGAFDNYYDKHSNDIAVIEAMLEIEGEIEEFLERTKISNTLHQIGIGGSCTFQNPSTSLAINWR